LLFAVSPLIVKFDRMPFDPSIIPFFTLLYFYSFYKWLNNDRRFFPVILFLLAVLYNLELATFTLVFPFLTVFTYGVLKKSVWIKQLINKKTVLLSLMAVLIPMAPIIVYDLSHGFKQTFVFLAWVIFKPFNTLLSHQPGDLFGNLYVILNFLITNIQKIIFALSPVLALLVFSGSIIYLVSQYFKKPKVRSANFILLLLLTISLLGILINQIPSEAYLPIVFPFLIFTVSIFFGRLLEVKWLRYATAFALIFIIVVNIYYSFLVTKESELQFRNNIVDQVIKLSNGQKYNLVGNGPASKFESFTMNYRYLLWYKGHAPSDQTQRMKIIITEANNSVTVIKKTE
jgi:hypothetical protein